MFIRLMIVLVSLLISMTSFAQNPEEIEEMYQANQERHEEIFNSETLRNLILQMERRKELIPSLDSYRDDVQGTFYERACARVEQHPFNLVATIIFALAIFHTFFAYYFTRWSHRLNHKHKELYGEQSSPRFLAECFHFLGEVEVVFGLWVFPLVLGIIYYYDWKTALSFLQTCNYVEPIFVVTIMVLSATKPITFLAESLLKQGALLGKESTGVWWCVILVFGSLLGSFITEPAAMTICSLLLIRYFYRYEPSRHLKYATLGLLFVNISIGGVLTNFAAPPVLMVARPWGWSSLYMFFHFGWKAILAIIINTSLYYFFFKKEFRILDKKKHEMLIKDESKIKIPLWITFAHAFFLILLVLNNHYPVVMVGIFLLFLGFYQATSYYQDELSLRPSILVGCFLAGLIVHGSLQGWWISLVLEMLSDYILMGFAIVLTSFNDNAAITYLATVTPNISPTSQYMIVAGAVTGGGLTVIANAPNPAGQLLLKKYFSDEVSPIRLFVAALLPTIIVALCFALFSNV